MTTEQKAQALVDAVRSEYPLVSELHATNIALIRNIEQHEATKQKAANAYQLLISEMQVGIARAEKQHEATKKELANVKQELADFRQEVSDALRDYYGGGYVPANSRFAQFIIPAPKPDPLDRVLSITSSLVDKETLRDRLKAEGLEIREKNQ